MNRRPGVFLDRDGVLNRDVGYPHLVADAILFEDVIPALKRFQHAGYVLVVVSNQSGVARGFFSIDEVSRFNGAIVRQLHRAHIRITSKNFYVCPHGPQDQCNCRKPEPGLLLRAARQHRIDLRRSLTIGDRENDIEAGRRVGTKTVFLNRDRKRHKTKADLVVTSLLDVAEIIERSGRSDMPATLQRRLPLD